MSLWDNVTGLWRKKDDTKPTVPENKKTGPAPLIRIYAILRSIQFKKLWPVFVSVPAIVFLAVSGLIAWVAVLVKFAVGVFRLW